MRLKVLVNPVAGRGKARKKIDAVLQQLRHSGATLEVDESRGSAHLSELARSASAAGFDRVVVCGGDGTVHHAVRQFDLTRGTLAIIPLGSGDDFARTLGIPSDPMRAATAVLHGVPRQVDVGIGNGIRFLVAASVGFDAAVARSVAGMKTRLRGSALYSWAALKLLPMFQPIPLRITVDGIAGNHEVMFVVAANTPRYGGGIRIAPAAVVDDHTLDLCIVSRASKLDLITTLPLAYFGRHTRRPFVAFQRGREFQIEGDRPLEVFADGELLTTTPVTIGVSAERLRVIVPMPR